MDTSDATVLGVGNVESMVNRSLEHRELNYTVSDEYRTTFALFRIISCVVYSLGVPGNLLSAVVWMRLYVATKNPSTLYLAALAITTSSGCYPTRFFRTSITATGRCTGCVRLFTVWFSPAKPTIRCLCSASPWHA